MNSMHTIRSIEVLRLRYRVIYSICEAEDKEVLDKYYVVIPQL